LGLDLGQRQDHSAIAVVRGAEEPDGAFDYVKWVQPVRTVWEADPLRRLPLGTLYTTVVEQVARLVRRPEMEGRCTVVADATGVGMPVMEMLRRAGMRARLMPVIVTSSSGPARCTEGVWHVGRRELLTGLREMLEERRVRIPETEVGKSLVEELANVELESGGRVRSGAERGAVHDDLAFALALACWRTRLGRAGLVGAGRVV